MINRRGSNNPNWKGGKSFKKNCPNCGKKIKSFSTYCVKCRFIFNNPFKNKHHSKETKELIGKKSKAKFTDEFITRVYREKCQGNKKRYINGYTLVKDYSHPNRNSHNDVLEHIKIMSDFLGRPIKKGEEIHHINFIRDDNRLENLYLYPSKSKHLSHHKSLFKLVDTLIKQNIITFEKGEYKMKKEEENRCKLGGTNG
jgi:hypothetical protein